MYEKKFLVFLDRKFVLGSRDLDALPPSQVERYLSTHKPRRQPPAYNPAVLIRRFSVQRAL